MSFNNITQCVLKKIFVRIKFTRESESEGSTYYILSLVTLLNLDPHFKHSIISHGGGFCS